MTRYLHVGARGDPWARRSGSLCATWRGHTPPVPRSRLLRCWGAGLRCSPTFSSRACPRAGGGVPVASGAPRTRKPGRTRAPGGHREAESRRGAHRRGGCCRPDTGPPAGLRHAGNALLGPLPRGSGTAEAARGRGQARAARWSGEHDATTAEGGEHSPGPATPTLPPRPAPGAANSLPFGSVRKGH